MSTLPPRYRITMRERGGRGNQRAELFGAWSTPSREDSGPKNVPARAGEPGRVYQIDAGWMGGAASIRYTKRPFRCVNLGLLGLRSIRLGHVGLDVHWYCEPSVRFK